MARPPFHMGIMGLPFFVYNKSGALAGAAPLIV
jgi:predicted DsbA family dithiol-disulfide isomerase